MVKTNYGRVRGANEEGGHVGAFGGDSDNVTPTILPQVLLPEIVIDAVADADANA